MNKNVSYIALFASLSLAVVLTMLVVLLVTFNRVIVKDQPYNPKGIVIDSVSVARGGFITVQDIRAPVSEVALSGYLQPGKYVNVFVGYITPDFDASETQGTVMGQTKQGDYLVVRVYENINSPLNFNGVPNYLQIENGTVRPMKDVFGNDMVYKIRLL